MLGQQSIAPTTTGDSVEPGRASRSRYQMPGLRVLEQRKRQTASAEAVPEEQLALRTRLNNPKTIASFGLAAAVMVAAIVKGGIDPEAMWQRLHGANIGLLVTAFVLYYAGFPLRGLRWKVLLQNAHGRSQQRGPDVSVRGLTEIIYISYFVNCIVPAKLGDLYRAYLAKLWGQISWARTVGTILAERVIDILLLSLLLSGAGLVVFHDRLGKVGAILYLGLGLTVAGVVVILCMKTLSPHIRRRIPARFSSSYISFEEGALQSFKRLPLLIGVTAFLWIMEGGRLQLVFASLGLHTHVSSVPFVPMLFCALGAAALTTIPFTPGGVGLVEIGLGSLMIYLGVPKIDAAAVVLLDRCITYYSITVFGFLVYLLSETSHFRYHAEAA